MKFLSSQMLHAVLLLLVLLYCGRAVYREAINTKAEVANLEDLASSNNSTPLLDTAGIDIYGKVLTDNSHVGTRKIVFLLRGSSLATDLGFWNSVNSQIAQHHDLELIGYCDSSQCVDDVKRAGSPPFPVIAGGNARDIQSMVNADANGQAYILEQGRPSFNKIEWRVSGNTAQKIVEEVTK